MARKLLFLWGFLLILAGSTSGELFTGEYFDDSIQLQYNRARFYDPKQARFVSQDIFPSSPTTPITLHRYAYGNADPINNSDPSGYFAGLSEFGNNLMIQSVLQSTRVTTYGIAYGSLSLRIALLTVAAGSTTYAVVSNKLKQQLEECMESSKRGENKCKGQNFYVLGDDAQGVRQHVSDAILDGHSATLRRQIPGHPRGWLEENKGPGKPCTKATGTQCDEYPYSSTIEGGAHNRVSLRSVPARDNSVAGGFLGAFYGKCRISQGTPFKTLLVKGVGSGYVCKD